MGGFDLHTHTVFSDGTVTPEELVALAVAEGLQGIALTDHDTLDGWERAAEACERHGLALVPGLELSAELDGHSVHLLGYWVDPEDEDLAAECARLRGERERRARVMVGRLRDLDVPVAWEEVAAIAGPAPVGRPHLATALVRHGAAVDVDDAFVRWLREDGPVYEPTHALHPVDAVRLVRAAGGAAVLAHPGPTFPDLDAAAALLDAMSRAGLGGLEADHPAHDEESAARWRAAADERGLLVTGASDFHGDRKAVRIGACATPEPVVTLLRDGTRGGTRW